ncbi:MAG: potassium transporter TrkH, partial [Rhodovulum sulfidophilum]
MAVPAIIDLIDGDPNARTFMGVLIVTVCLGVTIGLACAGGWRSDLSLRQGFLLT